MLTLILLTLNASNALATGGGGGGGNGGSGSSVPFISPILQFVFFMIACWIVKKQR